MSIHDPVYDYRTEKWLYPYEKGLALSADGHLMQRISDYLALDTDTGDFHEVSLWSDKAGDDRGPDDLVFGADEESGDGAWLLGEDDLLSYEEEDENAKEESDLFGDGDGDAEERSDFFGDEEEETLEDVSSEVKENSRGSILERYEIVYEYVDDPNSDLSGIEIDYANRAPNGRPRIILRRFKGDASWPKIKGAPEDPLAHIPGEEAAANEAESAEDADIPAAHPGTEATAEEERLPAAEQEESGENAQLAAAEEVLKNAPPEEIRGEELPAVEENEAFPAAPPARTPLEKNLTRIFAACVALIMIALLAWGGMAAKNAAERRKKAIAAANAAYERGMVYYEAGNYEKAFRAFRDAKEFGPASAEDYTSISLAMCDAKEGNFYNARSTLKWIASSTRSSEGIKEEARARLADVDVLEEAYKKEQQRIYREKVATGVPFVGMSERNISNTILGKPSGVRHNYEVRGGYQTRANLYDYTDGKGRRIFTARCLDGVVTQVFDKRDDIYDPAERAAALEKALKDQGKDLDASAFDHPEDFYDWYYDDFFDYEEAEEYWEEHHG